MVYSLIFVTLLLTLAPLHGKIMVGDQKSGQPTTAKPQLHDCMDERLMAADQAACVNMNLETLGKIKSHEGDSDIQYSNTNPKEYGPHYHHRRRRVAAEYLAWPKSTNDYVYVPYTFSRYTPSDTRYGFLLAIPEFTKSSCIRLIPRTTQKNYIEVISSSGCYSYLGMTGGRQPISLQAYTACTTKGVAIHEILHALGFYHEMARRDRDKHITINYNNIYSSYQRQFRKHLYAKGSVFGDPYDTQSIMQYGNYAFAINRSIRTITSNKNRTEVLGQRNGFSAKDLRQLNRMYKCKEFTKHV